MDIVPEDDLVSALSTISSALTGLRTEVQEIKINLEGERRGRWKTGFQAGLTDIRQLVSQIGEKLDRETLR
ncbi:MAG: hypothetical protein LBC31_02425 [Treponema sp.]|jgi:hypothetical protein|nr:hypothetical protein [Treponema sp.]